MSKKSKSPSRAQYHAPTPSNAEYAAEQPTAKKTVLKARPDAWSGETRGATFLTIGWMLNMLATAGALLACAAIWIALYRGVENEYLPFMLSYGIFFALATGFLTLVLGIIVNRIRNKPAPPSIRRFAGIVGALPWAIYAAMFLMSK